MSATRSPRGAQVPLALAVALSCAAACASAPRPRTPAEEKQRAETVGRVQAWLASRLRCAPEELTLAADSEEWGTLEFEWRRNRYRCSDDAESPHCGGWAAEPPGDADGGADAGGGGTELPVELHSLAASHVFEAILAQKPALAECAALSRRAQPALSGKILLRFSVEPSGRVSRARPLPKSLSESVFSRCIVGVVEGIRFPRHRVKGEPIVFPFKF